MTVGTPGQLLTVQVDTGSSDLFVTASNASFCSGPVGCAGGTFDPSRSSTYQVLVPGGYNSSFGDGTTEAGDLFTDIVQIGDIFLRGVELGVAYDVFSPVGANTALMGVGYSTNEGTSTGIIYPNFVDSLIYAGKLAGSNQASGRVPNSQRCDRVSLLQPIPERHSRIRCNPLRRRRHI